MPKFAPIDERNHHPHNANKLHSDRALTDIHLAEAHKMNHHHPRCARIFPVYSHIETRLTFTDTHTHTHRYSTDSVPYQLRDDSAVAVDASSIVAVADDDDDQDNYYFRRRPTSFLMSGSWGQASDGQPRYTWMPANADTVQQMESVRSVSSQYGWAGFFCKAGGTNQEIFYNPQVWC